MTIKWNWKDGDSVSSAKCGAIELSAWLAEPGRWHSTFDIKNGTEVASSYFDNKNGFGFKSQESAKKFAERAANKWVEKFLLSLDTN
jgi:hypothetical protein